MTKMRIRTKLACEFARVDRQQFNEAVANGLYQCAPPTSRGSSRLFTIDDVTALFIFGRMIRMGFGIREAAHIACEMRSQFDETHPGADLNERPLAIWVETVRGARHVMMSARSLPMSIGSGVGPVIGSIAFDVLSIRNHIGQLIQDETSIIGDDD